VSQQTRETLGSTLAGASHSAEKIAEAVHWDIPNEVGLSNAGYVAEAVQRFSSGISRRGIENFYDLDIKLIEFPLDELKKYFAGETSSIPNRIGAYIFAHFVKQQLSVLERIAQEIDTDDAA
jgi:hypothetical protein